jgi:hypothetical protein
MIKRRDFGKTLAAATITSLGPQPALSQAGRTPRQVHHSHTVTRSTCKDAGCIPTKPAVLIHCSPTRRAYDAVRSEAISIRKTGRCL